MLERNFRKKKVNFAPQEMIGVVIEAVVSGCLVASGIEMEQAALLGNSIGSAAKGISLSDSGSKDKILSSLEKAVLMVLDSRSYELTDMCRELLETEILSSKQIIRFMCLQDSDKLLKEQILQICERDPACDTSTFPIDKMIEKIKEMFEEEVLNNHELASYAVYCMLRKNTMKSEIYLANEQYVNSFMEPLFLHKHEKNTRVNLINLFILPKYEFIQKYEFITGVVNTFQERAENDLQGIIADFLHQDSKQFLFIEGDGGSGKTTLAAWLNYHYSLGDEIAQNLIGIRPLLTIRLRDLDKNDIAENSSLTTAICKYMNIGSLDELERLFPKAVMLLDGFDELCMIEGLGVQHEMLLYDLRRKRLDGFQFIVMTRPKFISQGIDIPSEFIFLKHFDYEQREKWLEHYTLDEYCAQKIDETVYEYIKNIDDDTASCICDTPMTLYMLAAKEGTEQFLENNWALYHHIFYEELSETEYNEMFPNPDRRYYHDIRKLRDVLYQVSEEIAYRMYQKQNQSFYLSNHELSAIVAKLSEKIPVLKQANMQDIAERCYALCCYWKANTDKGAVEFLHNNIRDFFLAEKIYREMEEIVSDLKGNKNIDFSTQFANKLCSLFQYSMLETKVLEFFYLRAKYNAENNKSDFARYEYKNQWIARILEEMSSEGVISSGVFTEKLSLNLVQRVTNILSCTVSVYRHIYEVHLKEKERILWISQSSVTNSILLPLFKTIFCQVPVTITEMEMITLGSRGIFDNVNFDNCDLRNIGFQNSNFESAKFSNAVLCGCDFSGAILDSADFTNADIHYASLKGASLKCCNMTGADLRGTELPDGFVSMDQDEQVKHLKALQIIGLKI